MATMKRLMRLRPLKPPMPPRPTIPTIDFELTTNWKSLLETDSLGALDFDTTINLLFLLSKEFGADCKLDFDDGKLAIMVFDDEESTKSCCGFLRYVCFDPTIN